MPDTETSAETTTIGRRYSAPQRRIAVVLVAQLRNFGRMSEILPSLEVLRVIDRFTRMASDAAAAYSGELLSRHNDTLVIVFRRATTPQCAHQAVRAAQAIQLEFGALAEDWQAAYRLQSAVSMGVHLGEIVSGLSGPETAQIEAIYGDTLTLAERLAERARTGEFVLSDSVMGALEVANLGLDAEPLPMLRLPDRPDTRIFGVLLDTRLDFTEAKSPRTADEVSTVPSLITTSRL